MSTSSELGLAAHASAVALRDLLVDEGDTWTVARVERQIAVVREDIDTACAAIRDQHGVDGHEAVDALNEMAAALLDIGEALNSGRSRIVTWTMPQAGSAALASYWLYGTAAWRQDIVDLNNLRDPNAIAAGTTLQVYEDPT